MTTKIIEETLQRLIAESYDIPLENVQIDYAYIGTTVKIPWEPEKILISFKIDSKVEDLKKSESKSIWNRFPKHLHR